MPTPTDRFTTLRGRVTVGVAQGDHVINRLCDAHPDVDWVPADPGASADVAVAADLALSESAYRIGVTDDGRVSIRGGARAGIVQGMEAMVRMVAPGAGGLEMPIGEIEHRPALAHRLFWVWDHSTHWDVDSIGQQETGAFNPYNKQPDVFIADFERMIDHLSRLGIGGVIVYGLLRDSHGGVEAANHICRYARDRGVRVIAGIAINAYGGIYYEGDHPFNLATWLRSHPELSVDTSRLPGFSIDGYGYLAFPQGDYTKAARSDSAAGERWHLEGIDWLLDTVKIDGINIEFGDYAGNDANADLHRLLPGLVDRALARRPDLLVVADVGWDHLVEPTTPASLGGLPGRCAYQFTYNHGYWPRIRDGLTPGTVERLPTRTNLIRPHAGSQWNRQRYADMSRHYADLARCAVRSGLSGVTIFGEVSPYSVPNEINYLAFARFTDDQDLTWEVFLAQEVFPRLGGADAARRFLTIVAHVDADDLDLTGLVRAREETRSHAAGLPDPQRRRWGWLEERLSRRIHSQSGR